MAVNAATIMTLAFCVSSSSSSLFLSFCCTTQLDFNHLRHETSTYRILVNNINMLIILGSTDFGTWCITTATSSARCRAPKGHHGQRKKGQIFERNIFQSFESRKTSTF